MKRYFLTLALAVLSAALFAAPARRAFTNCTLQDGTTISLTLAGDEFAHWYESADGTIYTRNTDGTFSRSDVTPADMSQRRKASRRYQNAQQRRARKDVGTSPNLAPRGVVILVNFSDLEMQTEHTLEVFDELFNGEDCTVNSFDGKDYPSAREYFRSQSNGLYAPQFDVFGPVTLSKNYAYYGQNDDDGNDMYPTDAVIEACILAKQQYPELNFANYDSDGDQFVDFIYVVYAGESEASGGSENTIWPHNYQILYAVLPFNEWGEYDPDNGERWSCCYTEDDVVIDDVVLNNYAMSSELMGNELGGIGTLCHEFGHVMGLPDLYDTQYESNYKQSLTPNEWNIMDGGSYNGNGHCPPNYDPWEKYFMGWITPTNLGDSAQTITLYPNGSDEYQAYQINASGTQQEATQAGVNYYIENRQQQGWDEFVPASGMLIWKVDFDENAWVSNSLNNTAGKPRYTLVIPSGKKIGWDYGEKNVWPYRDTNSWEGVSGKPLKDITRSGELIDLIYISDPNEQAVETTTADTRAIKLIENGQIIIRRGEKQYNILGVQQ